MIKLLLGSALIFSATVASAQFGDVFSGVPSDLSSSLDLLSQEQEKREESVATALNKSGENVQDVRHITGNYFKVKTDKCKYKVIASDDQISILTNSKKCK